MYTIYFKANNALVITDNYGIMYLNSNHAHNGFGNLADNMFLMNPLIKLK